MKLTAHITIENSSKRPTLITIVADVEYNDSVEVIKIYAEQKGSDHRIHSVDITEFCDMNNLTDDLVDSIDWNYLYKTQDL
jgi:hypothetical protein